MSRISDFLTPGTPVVVAPVTRSEAHLGNQPAVSFWDELQGQAEVLLGSILRAKASDGTPARTIGLTSFYRQEGVSTIASVLARAAVSQRRTLLIDANWSHPGLAVLSGVAAEPGLAQVLSGEREVFECIQELSSGVSLLTAGHTGKINSARSSNVSAENLAPVLRSVLEAFELVLIDLPSIRENPSTFEICPMFDGIALIVEAERVHWQAGQRELVRLRQAGAHLLGAVLNKRRDYLPDWLYRIL